MENRKQHRSLWSEQAFEIGQVLTSVRARQDMEKDDARTIKGWRLFSRVEHAGSKRRYHYT